MNNIMNNPDWRSLCAELLETIDMLLEGDRRPEDERGAYIRSLLAQPEPEVKRIDLDAIKQAIEERDDAVRQYHDLAQNMVYHGNSVSHWHCKATAYKDAIGKVWSELQTAGIACDGNKSCAEGVCELASRKTPSIQLQPEPVVDDDFVTAVNDLAKRTHKSKAEVLRDAINLYYKAVNEWEKNGRGIVFQKITQPEPTEQDLATLWNRCGTFDECEYHNGNIFQYARAVLARWGRPTIQPVPESAFTDLATRPLLEKVARMADCIDQRTVGEIAAISDQAAAWLEANPLGQPVAIEPRGCPTPGACSCVEPVAQPEPVPTLANTINQEGY